tara:strand:+ start:3322 stop:3849 length:528 start_codon:yes stop_codon:yes gene_type:complete
MTEIYLWTEKTTKNILGEDLATYQDVSCTILKTMIKNDQTITGLHLSYTLTPIDQQLSSLPEWNAMYQSSEYNNNGTTISTGIDQSNNSVIVQHGWSVTGVNKSQDDSSKNRLLFAGTVNQSLTSIEGPSQQYEEQTLANFVNTQFNIDSIIGISNEIGQLYDPNTYQIGNPSLI